jgi:hypothetical protein
MKRSQHVVYANSLRWLRVALAASALGCGCDQRSAAAAGESPPAQAALQAERAKPGALAAPPPAAPAPAAITPAAAPQAPAAAPAAKVAADAPCAALCVHSTELKCGEAENCGALCKQSLSGEICAAEQRAANACMLTQPTANWECSEMGVAALKDGFCEHEQEAFLKCMLAQQGS